MKMKSFLVSLIVVVCIVSNIFLWWQLLSRKENKSAIPNTAQTSHSSNSSSLSSSSSSDKSEQVHNLFNSVLERLKQYRLYGSSKDYTSFTDLRSQQDEKEWILANSMYERSSGNSYYTYYDINKDGVDELLVGSTEFLEAIYYLHNQKPEIVFGAGVASAGGQRKGLNIYQDGQIVATEFTSLSPDATATFFVIKSTPAQVVKTDEKPFQINGGDVDTQLGLANNGKLDLASLNWELLPISSETGKIENSLSSNSNQKTMNVNQLIRGDFSSIAGKWQRKGNGEILSFDSNGLISEFSELDLSRAQITDGIVTMTTKRKGVPVGQGAGGAPIVFIPKGVRLTNSFIGGVGELVDESDITKDRIWSGQNSVFTDDVFFYRVD